MHFLQEKRLFAAYSKYPSQDTLATQDRPVKLP
jgi:hypothetical protein